ncbi:hypothetical protein V1264_015910 [Littorina saxatilis]
MTEEDFILWQDPAFYFVCRCCAFEGDLYSAAKVLRRFAAAPPLEIEKVAKSEALLVKLYSSVTSPAVEVEADDDSTASNVEDVDSNVISPDFLCSTTIDDMHDSDVEPVDCYHTSAVEVEAIDVAESSFSASFIDSILISPHVSDNEDVASSGISPDMYDSNVISSSPDVSGCDELNANGTHLPRGHFLEVDVLVSILKSAELPECSDEVPAGRKDDAYFLVKNERNVDRRMNGSRSNFYDDRGVWGSKGTSNKSLYVSKGGKLAQVLLKDGKYCFRRQENRQIVFVPLDPQPSEVITLHRYYVKHGASPGYEKRVSWLSSDPTVAAIAVHEYKGTMTHESVHGRTGSGNPGNYIRLDPDLMTKVRKDTSKTPRQVYFEHTQTDDGHSLRNRKQVYNCRYRAKKQEEPSTSHKANFADQVAGVEDLQMSLPFIQLVVRQNGKVPCIILYNNDQMSDLKRFCCPPLTAQSTVLGVDKTFNLSDVHVTCTVYKNLAVKNRTTKEHPIFFGPLFLHGDSDTDTYFLFFQRLAGELAHCDQSPIWGSDEETAIRSAVIKAFPASIRLSCTLHLKKNLDAVLADKVGLPRSERKGIVNSIFTKRGFLASATDTADVRDSVQHIMDSSDNIILQRHLARITPLLEDNVRGSHKPGLLLPSALWTNNNAESANHVLKHAVQWKSQKLVDLVQVIHGVITQQFNEVKRAMYGYGDYDLADEYQQFAVPYGVWQKKTLQQRERHLLKFSKTLKCVNSVRSTDGSKSAVAPTHKGRKPGQKKRTRTAKTSTPQPKRIRTRAPSSTDEDFETLPE